MRVKEVLFDDVEHCLKLAKDENSVLGDGGREREIVDLRGGCERGGTDAAVGEDLSG